MSFLEKEFETLYNQYIDMIYRLCFSFLKNREDTEDAVQTVFVKYLKKKKRLVNENHEKAWFIVTASNVCKDMLRQSWRKHDRSMERYDEIAVRKDAADHEMEMAVMSLPDKYKTVVYLYYYEGYQTKEIAEILHKPASTIRNYLTEARRHLKKILGGTL